jgi:hypothetical protein
VFDVYLYNFYLLAFVVGVVLLVCEGIIVFMLLFLALTVELGFVTFIDIVVVKYESLTNLNLESS